MTPRMGRASELRVESTVSAMTSPPILFDERSAVSERPKRRVGSALNVRMTQQNDSHGTCTLVGTLAFSDESCEPSDMIVD